MDPLVLFYPEDHQKHAFRGHPERPERVEVIREALIEAGYWNSYPAISPSIPDDGLLASIHERDYLNLLEQTSKKEGMLDPDTYATRDSWKLALQAAGGALAVVDRVWERQALTGFALTRPPGHHATRSRAMGFCLINNAAIAAQYLLDEKHAESVAILDLDLHHGNGTQDIFWENGDVYYISVHQAPFYPGTGYLFETGSGLGEGATLNLPIPAFSGDTAYKELLIQVILPYLNEANPDMLLISFGFDIHWLDPLGSLQVSANGIYRMMMDLRSWAEDHCQGRIAVILEGGYDLEAGKACGKAVTAGLLNEHWEDLLGDSHQGEGDAWRKTLSEARELLGY
jgi:acetoin utilization deacetylase AcuC-like enzyme